MGYSRVMTLYQQISKAYDHLFPSSPEKLNFIAGLLQDIDSARILDIGCATGEMLFQLERKGLSAGIGIDLDEQMIHEAERKRREANIANIEFRVLDMMRIDSARGIEGVDLMCCMGNTLAYAPHMERVHSFLRKCSNVLNAGGSLVIQILNYENPRIGPGFSFPELSGGGLQLCRSYEQTSGYQYKFLTRITDLQTGATEHDIHYHSPFLSEEICAAAGREGFTTIERIGSYSGKDPEPDDFFHLIICRK